jgi:hypothetical protein
MLSHAMTDGVLDEVLAALVDHDSMITFDLVLEQAGVWDEFPDRTGAEIDEGFRELRHRGWIRGEDQEGDGSVVWWSMVRPTVYGLRHLGEWPPEGREYQPGGWDTRTWGTGDREQLRALDKSPPRAGVVERPGLGEADGSREWEAYMRLREAGLIEAELGEGYLQSVRLTTVGRNALHPPEDDPLVRSRVYLRQGAKADAVTAAIDEALKPCLLGLAGPADVRPEEVPAKLSALNDQLKAHGAYGGSAFVSEAVRARVDAWLKLRNVIDHGEGDQVAERWIELLIDGVERFRDEFR